MKKESMPEAIALLASAKVTASRKIFASDKRPYTFEMPNGGEQYTLAEIRRVVSGGKAQP